MAVGLSAVGRGKAGVGGPPAPHGAMGGPDAHGGHNEQHIASDAIAGDGRGHTSAAANLLCLRCLRELELLHD